MYTNKINNLEEMDKFLERYNLKDWMRKKWKIWTDQSQVLKLQLWLKLFQQDFPGGAMVKNPLANAGDMGSILGPWRPHMPQSN